LPTTRNRSKVEVWVRAQNRPLVTPERESNEDLIFHCLTGDQALIAVRAVLIIFIIFVAFGACCDLASLGLVKSQAFLRKLSLAFYTAAGE